MVFKFSYCFLLMLTGENFEKESLMGNPIDTVYGELGNTTKTPSIGIFEGCKPVSLKLSAWLSTEAYYTRCIKIYTAAFIKV